MVSFLIAVHSESGAVADCAAIGFTEDLQCSVCDSFRSLGDKRTHHVKCSARDSLMLLLPQS